MPTNSNITLKKIVDFSRRKGFVFPSSEIYGGFAATYDFGPLGMMLKKNIESAWRYLNITTRTDMVEIEGAIFMHPKVWQASGHIDGFSDILVEDTVTHKRYRADHLIEDAKVNLPSFLVEKYGKKESSGDTSTLLEKEKLTESASLLVTNAGSFTLEEIDQIIEFYKIKSPDGNTLSKAKRFNLLVKTHLGPVEDETSVVYLKGESCQNIYVNWKAVQETTRRKLPFGIAQIGKAFRNEITVKQFMFRTREFEQVDVQYFCKPEEADNWYTYWKDYTFNFYHQSLGLNLENLGWRQHTPEERAFYAKDAWDIEYHFGELGFKELGGLHHRGSYDLDQHSKFSGQDLSYFDSQTGTRFNPFIIEASLGFNRMFLSVLFEHYHEEQLDKETRIVFKLPFNLAPFKVAILPLMKKDGLAKKAQEIHIYLRKQGIMCDYDEAGSVGKRYRRQDENGTPWCVTVDYQTMRDETVTIRHRDTMNQQRIALSDLEKYLNSEAF